MMKYALLTACVLTTLSGAGQHLLDRVDSLLLSADYEQTITVVDQNLNTDDVLLKTRLKNRKAEALIRSGKLAEAETVLKTIDPKVLSGVTKTNLGALYINHGRNDLALEMLQEAMQHFEEENMTQSLDAALAMNYLGQVYKFTGKHAQAEEQIRMALSIRQHILEEDHELIAGSYNDLGLVYLGIDNDKALEHYEKAQVIYTKLHGAGHPKIAISFTNIGVAYRELQLYGDAVNNFESALAIWNKVYSHPHQAKAFVLSNLGQTYFAIGDHKAGRAYYDQALAMYRRSYGEKHPDISGVLNAIGNAELAQGSYDNALIHFQQALVANVSDFDRGDININPRLENFYHGNVLLYSLMYKAEALEGRYFGKTLKFSDLDFALNTLLSCDSLIDQLRQQSTNESDKIALGVLANEVYANGVRIAHEAATAAWKKKPYRELSFYFAEKSKSAVLLEAISDADAKSFAGIPPELLDEENTLKSAIALTAQKLSQKPSPEEEKYLRETLFSLNQTYRDFIGNLEKQFPSYFNLKYNIHIPTIIQLQQLLDPGTAMLSYFIDDYSNHNADAKRLYLFIITKDDFHIVDHQLPDDFEKYITGLRNGVYFNVFSVFAQAVNQLSALLIPKNLSKEIHDLVILPTGRLGIIPFEVLVTEPTDISGDYRDVDYLLRKYTARYEFSAGLLLQKSSQSRPKEPSILLCAPVEFPGNENLMQLPATELEVNDISRLFASKNISSALFTHQQANEHMIKTSGLKNYSLVHFATHGVVDENDPELSRIFLQRSDEAEDGNLFSGEIYNLELDANLVTLSACETGLGKISKGEGVIGLSRALVYAGARNIIVSFWSVADESTAGLMTDFYQELLGNSSAGYAENLRQAKLGLLKSEKYAAPFYWAPFILIGF